jgi:hypothetical protein
MTVVSLAPGTARLKTVPWPAGAMAGAPGRLSSNATRCRYAELDLATGLPELVVAVAAIALAFMGHRLAPLVAVAHGFSQALGVAAVHLLPRWSAFGDSFSDAWADVLSWAAVVVEIVAHSGSPWRARTSWAGASSTGRPPIPAGSGPRRVMARTVLGCPIGRPWLRGAAVARPDGGAATPSTDGRRLCRPGYFANRNSKPMPSGRISPVPNRLRATIRSRAA